MGKYQNKNVQVSSMDLFLVLWEQMIADRVPASISRTFNSLTQILDKRITQFQWIRRKQLSCSTTPKTSLEGNSNQLFISSHFYRQNVIYNWLCAPRKRNIIEKVILVANCTPIRTNNYFNQGRSYTILREFIRTPFGGKLYYLHMVKIIFKVYSRWWIPFFRFWTTLVKTLVPPLILTKERSSSFPVNNHI